MPELLGYNPDRGTWYEAEFDDLGNATIATMQDTQPLIDHIQRQRNSGYIDRGIKKGWWKYCSIPAWLEVELRSKGINIYRREQTNELLRYIDENYPALKYTDKTHRVNLS